MAKKQIMLGLLMLGLGLMAALLALPTRAAPHASVTRPSALVTTPPFSLTFMPLAAGFAAPVGIVNAGDDRLFIVQQTGQIRIMNITGTVVVTPFLDISNTIALQNYEQGLLGLAFDPNYASNGYFYAHYTALNWDVKISRFQVSADPNVANPASEVNLLTIPHGDYENHNGGQLQFGPDGYLYIAVGDGGSSDDPGNNAQNLNTWLGKILRINVSGQTTYTIPAGNPFTQTVNARPEIWSFGLRNPWRFSFDRATGNLYIADVGQGGYEEINVEPAGAGGRNYGWRCYEGLHINPNVPACPTPTITYTMPIFEYDHTQGNVVTGGYVYRGARYPAMQGYYFFADFGSGRWWAMDMLANTVTGLGQPLAEVTTLGEDAAGELYLATYGGHIYRLRDGLQRVYLPFVRR
jgi:glucose/arabinose dehydrogenase